MAGRARRSARAAERLHAETLHAQFMFGRSRDPLLGGPGGSPFQMPARLADGLGPGSDLGHGYPRPFAPSSNFAIRGIWVPRVDPQEGKPT